MPKKPQQDEGLNCPIYRQDVSEVCHKCEWYTLVRGKHPQTLETIDQWGCAIAFAPMLLINAAQEARQGAAATESFRNVMVQMANNSTRRDALEASRQSTIGSSQ